MNTIRCLLGLWTALALGADYSLTQEPTQVVSGQVIDEDDLPVEGVDVLCVESFGPALVSPDHLTLLTRTDDDGRFEFDWEEYERAGSRSGLLFRRKGYANVRYRNIPSWELPPVRMHRGYTLSGVVRDVGGEPIPGTTVVSIDMLATWESFLDSMVWAPGINVACTVTDSTGRFRLDGVLAHGLDLVFSHPRHLVHERFAVDVGDPLDITLKPGGTIRGRVLDRHGRPYAGLYVAIKHDTIRWRYRPSRPPVKTDEKGRFELPRMESYPYVISIGTGIPPLGFHSELLTGDRDDLEFKVDYSPEDVAWESAEESVTEREPGSSVRLIVTDGDNDAPIGAFQAAALNTTHTRGSMTGGRTGGPSGSRKLPERGRTANSC